MAAAARRRAVFPAEDSRRPFWVTVIPAPRSRVDKVHSTTRESTLKKIPLILLMSFGLASAAFAQTATGGITMSTDPAKAAAVEKHAAELKARPATESQAKPAAKASTTHKTKAHAKQPKTSAKPAATPAATK